MNRAGTARSSDVPASRRRRRWWRRGGLSQEELGARGGERSASLARLEAVWAERDAEIAARLNAPPVARFVCERCGAAFVIPEALQVHGEEAHGDPVLDEEGRVSEPGLQGGAEVNYKFECRRCHSRFSLEQQRDEHQKTCGGSAAGAQARPGRKIPCRLCGYEAADMGDLSRHRYKEHAAEIRAARVAAAGGSERRPAPSPATSPANGNGPCCPTCGGRLPETVARLVDELKRAGLAEPQALQAAGIARRLLTAPAAA